MTKQLEQAVGHTPGPWKLQTETPRRPASVIDTSDQIVAEVFGYSRDSRKANARLIAAAPEMLEALRHALDYVTDSELQVDVEATIRTAIAKAEGRDS